jgi:hypothetical protein
MRWQHRRTNPNVHRAPEQRAHAKCEWKQVGESGSEPPRRLDNRTFSWKLRGRCASAAAQSPRLNISRGSEPHYQRAPASSICVLDGSGPRSSMLPPKTPRQSTKEQHGENAGPYGNDRTADRDLDSQNQSENVEKSNKDDHN